MNFAEFKHWLDGFSEAMADAPTPEQWAKIKAKLAQVNAYAIGDFGKVMPGPFPLRPIPGRSGDVYLGQHIITTSNTPNAKAS